ncbi:MAG: hypothetical protein KJ926_03615, partial [Candidatus Omnitrophica bacterium]|nr:hypothetical protein [Candidatus Omnitrophota bacterium]
AGLEGAWEYYKLNKDKLLEGKLSTAGFSYAAIQSLFNSLFSAKDGQFTSGQSQVAYLGDGKLKITRQMGDFIYEEIRDKSGAVKEVRLDGKLIEGRRRIAERIEEITLDGRRGKVYLIDGDKWTIAPDASLVPEWMKFETERKQARFGGDVTKGLMVEFEDEVRAGVVRKLQGQIVGYREYNGQKFYIVEAWNSKLDRENTNIDKTNKAGDYILSEDGKVISTSRGGRYVLTEQATKLPYEFMIRPEGNGQVRMLIRNDKPEEKAGDIASNPQKYFDIVIGVDQQGNPLSDQTAIERIGTGDIVVLQSQDGTGERKIARLVGGEGSQRKLEYITLSEGGYTANSVFRFGSVEAITGEKKTEGFRIVSWVKNMLKDESPRLAQARSEYEDAKSAMVELAWQTGETGGLDFNSDDYKSAAARIKEAERILRSAETLDKRVFFVLNRQTGKLEKIDFNDPAKAAQQLGFDLKEDQVMLDNNVKLLVNRKELESRGVMLKDTVNAGIEHVLNALADKNTETRGSSHLSNLVGRFSRWMGSAVGNKLADYFPQKEVMDDAGNGLVNIKTNDIDIAFIKNGKLYIGRVDGRELKPIVEPKSSGSKEWAELNNRLEDLNTLAAGQGALEVAMWAPVVGQIGRAGYLAYRAGSIASRVASAGGSELMIQKAVLTGKKAAA